ncbi:MAG: FMN-binding negative transcriptional regulator [Ferruginibacter sp.]|nr:FMN-binding negative transcriptional regulator [Ferruginibacter sp.]
MHSNSNYKVTDKATIVAFIKKYSFATIIGNVDGVAFSSQIPLLIEEVNDKIILLGHIIRKTNHYNALLKNNNALLIFNGPHTYVSASWYTNPAGASTWNYMTVNARGKINFLDDNGTRNAIRLLTAKYESEESLAAFDRMSEEYIAANLKAIVGFTIEVDEFDAVFKLSQNRDEISRNNIIAQLKKSDDFNSVAIAEEMSKRNS